VVNAADLKISDDYLAEVVERISGGLEVADKAEFFASLAWSVICEPGDSFAGKLISALGPDEALALELEATSALKYREIFEARDLDWVEMQSFGRFERSLLEARERWKSRISLSVIDKAISEMTLHNGFFIYESSFEWPKALADLGDFAPRGLWVRGSRQAIESLDKSVSIVGSRMATSYGQFVTTDLVSELVSHKFTIVSGGAYGIDAMAHRSALAVGLPTIAVMAGGLDRLYPSGNAELFKQIEREGALISEMPPGAEPTKWRFLQRNRLIAALGAATVVVEANPRSGAVSTANRALEIGRPLGAVPGPINSAGSDGCHRLIRETEAQLISSGQDLLELLGQQQGFNLDSPGLGALETRVLDVIGFGTAGMEQIRSEAGLTREEARTGLSGLVLLGIVEQNAEGWARVYAG